jgi:hypothetical protein
MSPLNRRSILAGAAAAPIAALASNASGSPADTDAKILTLGAELEAVGNDWLLRTRRSQERRAALEERVFAATGIARADALPRDEDGEYWRVHDEIADDLPSDDPDLQEWVEIHGRLYPLAKEILSCRPRTAAGLAVQAQAIALFYGELWDDETLEVLEPADRYTRAFIESVCAFAGIKSIPMIAWETSRVQS